MAPSNLIQTISATTNQIPSPEDLRILNTCRQGRFPTIYTAESNIASNSMADVEYESQDQTISPLLEFPIELVEHIMLKADDHTVANFSYTCRQVRLVSLTGHTRRRFGFSFSSNAIKGIFDAIIADDDPCTLTCFSLVSKRFNFVFKQLEPVIQESIKGFKNQRIWKNVPTRLYRNAIKLYTSRAFVGEWLGEKYQWHSRSCKFITEEAMRRHNEEGENIKWLVASRKD